MCGFEFVDDEVTDTQGFLMYNQEFLVICFRGTESIRDWMTNLNFVQVSICTNYWRMCLIQEGGSKSIPAALSQEWSTR